jgi:hypothetical protein
MFVVFIQCPANPIHQTDHEGVEARGRPHCNATAVALLHRRHHPCFNHHHRHVFLVVDSR